MSSLQTYFYMFSIPRMSKTQLAVAIMCKQCAKLPSAALANPTIEKKTQISTKAFSHSASVRPVYIPTSS